MQRQKEEIFQMIKDTGLVAVIRASTEEQARYLAEECIAGGVKAIEITFTVPYAHHIIEQVSKAYGKQIIVGAGTVLDTETARIALLSGAEFVVSPHFDPEVARTCNRYRVLYMAGIMTVKEAVQAMEAGTDILKLFPGEAFGPDLIKALRGPLPYVQIIPTGGVDTDNAGQWLCAGAMAVGAGGKLTCGNVRANAELFLKKIREAREGSICNGGKISGSIETSSIGTL